MAMPLTVHMLTHMAIVAVAAPVVALAIRGRRIDPVMRAPRWFSPLPASLLEFAIDPSVTPPGRTARRATPTWTGRAASRTGVLSTFDKRIPGLLSDVNKSARIAGTNDGVSFR